MSRVLTDKVIVHETAKLVAARVYGRGSDFGNRSLMPPPGEGGGRGLRSFDVQDYGTGKRPIPPDRSGPTPIRRSARPSKVSALTKKRPEARQVPGLP